MNENDKTPKEVVMILLDSIFNYKQPCKRAESVLKLLGEKQVDKLMDYILNYSKPNLFRLVDLLEQGINKKIAVKSLIELESKLNEILDKLSDLDENDLRQRQKDLLKEAAYIDTFIKEKKINKINNNLI